MLLLIVGLAWAKWLPYVEKSGALADSGSWSGGPIFEAAGPAGSVRTLSGAWAFTVDYFVAVWRALVVAVLLGAALDALVPRRWLLAVLTRSTRSRQAFVGGALSLPAMMCSCCSAPVTVGMRRRGAPLSASVAFWLGNPVLNPAVLVFLILVLPWPYATARLLVGVVLVVVAALVAARVAARDPASARTVQATAAIDAGDDDPTLRELPGRYLRSLARFTLVLVPEYVVVVFALGLVSGSLSDFAGWQRDLGLAALVAVALVATALVIPTGGEIPVVAALAAVGAEAALGGVLLIALPALSVPSMVMVGRALGWRATGAVAGVVVAASLVAGGVLAVLV